MADEKQKSQFDAAQFDAEGVERLSALNHSGRIELRFVDADQRQHIVTLPIEAAVALGRLICDLAEGTPFLQVPPKPGKPHPGR